MTSAPVTPAIERSLVLRAPPDRVWNALTRPDELSKWLGQRADLRLEVGYDGWIEWDGHGRYPLRVEEVVAPSRFAWRWMNKPAEVIDLTRATLVEWMLEPTPFGGTRLHLRETGFDSTDRRAGNAMGWLAELGDLLEYVAEQPRDVGVRRTWQLDAPAGLVWAALADQGRLAAWWAGAPGTDVRVESIEPETYIAWLWAPATNAPADASDEVAVEWALEADDGGQTKLRLLMTGFVTGEALREGAAFIDDVALPALERLLGARAGSA
ncbi:MAG TPA: SRPBCC domain-containing protein [Candidatus Deferrimicrobiaceae bacterium]|nr:SRPBCC domain-containing protein [Candidatus Deferrimicrobiaceae bacterium]